MATIFVLLSAVACSRSVSVSIDTGRLSGVREGSIVAYKGIPFAEPPVGSLRWKPPQRAKKWTGTLGANTFKPQCMQLGPPLPTMPLEPNSEDCLYLNLWAPVSQDESKRAVMVFLYGGGFRRGSASTPLYWGDRLAMSKGVIVVNLAYRLGPLGFLAHPELTAESPHHVSGNYGLLDMIAGLEWVQRNIGAFGGDPKNVTVMGHSAGAWALNKLMISPLATGLFSKAIAESGGDMGPSRTSEGIAVLEDAEKTGAAFVTALGANSIAELRRLSAEKIVATQFKGLAGIPHSDGSLPVQDGYVIPGDTYELYAAGKQAKIPLLIGYTDDEAVNLIQPIDAEKYAANMRAQYGDLADEFLRLYPATPAAAAARSQTRLTSEAWIGWQVWAWASVHARTSQNKVFFYHFVGPPAFHGAELPYVFAQTFAVPADSRGMAQTVSSYWTNFAKGGDPNGERLAVWPAFVGDGANTMYLGLTSEVGTAPDLREHELMDVYMNDVRRRRIVSSTNN